jgi:hypothetical protein
MEVAGGGQHAHVARVSAAWALGAGMLGVGEFVGPAERLAGLVIGREARQFGRAIHDLRCHQVDDAFLALLDDAAHFHQARCHDGGAIFLEVGGPEQHVGDASFILQRHEDRLALAGALANQDDAGHARGAPIGQIGKGGGAENAFRLEERAQEGHWIRLQGQTRHLVIGGNLFGQRHHGKRGIVLSRQFARIGGGEKGKRVLRRAADFPQRIAPAEIERAKRIGIGEQG